MIADKILLEHQVRVDAWRRFYGGRIILATGCFDVLHRGHVELFQMARARRPSGLLWVGLNSDRAVRELKGPERPVHSYPDRAYVVAALQSVDRVFEIDDMRVAETIRLIRPIAWIKGGDYTLNTLDKDEVAAAREVDAEIVLIPTIGNYSTTNTLKKLNACEPSGTPGT